MKNIIIIGPPRTGKTTFSRRILKEFPNYNYLSGDAIVCSNQEIIEEERTDFISKNVIKMNVVKNLDTKILDLSVDFEKDLNFILDSSFTKIEDILDYDTQKFIIIAFGFPDITLEEGITNLNKYDNEKEWTYSENNFKKEMIIKDSIIKSKELQKKCNKHNIKFINTSHNRDQAINEAFIWLKNNI